MLVTSGALRVKIALRDGFPSLQRPATATVSFTQASGTILHTWTKTVLATT